MLFCTFVSALSYTKVYKEEPSHILPYFFRPGGTSVCNTFYIFALAPSCRLVFLLFYILHVELVYNPEPRIKEAQLHQKCNIDSNLIKHDNAYTWFVIVLKNLLFGTLLLAHNRNSFWHNHTMVLRENQSGYISWHILLYTLAYPHIYLSRLFRISTCMYKKEKL